MPCLSLEIVGDYPRVPGGGPDKTLRPDWINLGRHINGHFLIPARVGFSASDRQTANEDVLTQRPVGKARNNVKNNAPELLA